MKRLLLVRSAPLKALLTFGLLFLQVRLAAAQVGVSGSSDPHEKIQFLPRYAFHLSAEYFPGADKRFVWDTNFGGEFDVIDFAHRSRLIVEANYQAILGEEMRPFDPNQGNYILSSRVSTRARGFDLAGVFYHQSRHLSDRSKQLAVDWNMLGGRVSKIFAKESMTIDTRVDLRAVTHKRQVDYSWELEGDARSTIPLRHGRIGLIGGVTVRVLGVDGSQNRGTQHGYRAEGGLRLNGKAGAIELYLSGEQRIDPFPLEHSTGRWIGFGLRVLGGSK